MSSNLPSAIAAVITGLATSLVPLQVKAGETWVMASWEMQGEGQPGTLAHEYDWHGMAYYLDLQSTVRRGDLVFYYDSWIPVNAKKKPVLLWNNKQQKPETKYLRTANCTTLKVKAKEDGDFKRADPAYRPLIKLACSD